MGIGYQDFFPEVVKSGFFNKEYEKLSATVARANQWISSKGLRIINVETVVLPNIQNVKDAGRIGARTSSEGNVWYQFVRVWHEVPDVNT